MAEVILKHLSKSFGTDVALDDVSLTIPDGAFVVLLGPTGAGKTTTLRLISGLEKADGGEVWIKDGLDVVKSETLWVDKERDIAIIRPMGELYMTKPVKFKVNMDNNKVGTIVRYAGYPSELGKMVLQGMVAKQTEQKKSNCAA